MFVIWNINTGRPVKSGLPKPTATRLANLLERMFDAPYLVRRA